MRLIDVDVMLHELANQSFPQSGEYGRARQRLIADLRNAPTVDAVPVIRCKDCKYYEEQDETIGTCLLTESGAHIKGYCSWAEWSEE